MMLEPGDPRTLRARSEVEAARVEGSSNLAAELAAREACLKLFPGEGSRGELRLEDVAALKALGGGPLELAPERKIQRMLDQYRLKTVKISTGRQGEAVFAEARAEPAVARPGLLGKLLFHFFPVRRRVVLANLRRVFGGRIPDAEIRRIAQAFYAHFARLLIDCLRLPWLSAGRRARLVRVENAAAPLAAAAKGKGVLILTGHFGSWEVAPVLGLGNFPEHKGRVHFLRRPIRARWIESFVMRRFQRGGMGVIGKKGSLPLILDCLQAGDAVVFVLDQHAARKDAVEARFFGHPASTFKSLAVIALATGAPVIPAYSWREPDGSHVLRFEEPLPLIERESADEAILANTQAFNDELERLLLRHPEQWFWMHRRWKERR
jgi:KDO2-lipid IV(A) lauroyltransferase